MGTRKILTAAIAAVVLLGLGLVAAPSAGQNSAPAPAAGQAAAPGGIPLVDCEISWEDQRTISSKIQGRIAERPVKDGQLVDVDQILARLDDREAKLELKRQEILGNSDLNERKEYKKLEEYSARRESAERLDRIQAIAREERRMADVNVEFSELSMQKEAETRRIEKIKAEQAEVLLNEHVIRSPIRGMIKKCFKREMELVTPSDHQLFHIVATDKVWVEGWAPVSQVYKVRVGQNVNMSLALLRRSTTRVPVDRPSPISPGLPSSTSRPLRTPEPLPEETPIELPEGVDNSFEGTIVFVDPDVDFGAGRFRVRAEVQNKYDPDSNLPILRAGMNANMTIKGKSAAKNGETKY
jgi:multidrug efflux pump subunit AcrA (membrane-fusion protein)